MTTTPLATIADALLDFIMSLLHDPAAAQEYQENPSGSLANAGLADACMADVRQVLPVIYEQPTVVYRPSSTPPPADATPVEKAIWNVYNNYVQNHTTVADSSTHQNVWMNGGELTQNFDQQSIAFEGDGNAIGAGGTATIDNNVNMTGSGDITTGSGDHTDITMGDDNFSPTVTDTTTVSDSFNGDGNQGGVDVTDDTDVSAGVAVANDLGTDDSHESAPVIEDSSDASTESVLPLDETDDPENPDNNDI